VYHGSNKQRNKSESNVMAVSKKVLLQLLPEDTKENQTAQPIILTEYLLYTN
jgi:hypothetical protein